MREDQEASGFELLDDEGQPQRRRERQRGMRWEMLLGLVLVVGLLGWGGWDWWRNQSALASYREAEGYLARHEWEAAYRAFLAAGDYAGAARRAAEIARSITQRDTGYAAAAAAAAGGRWIAALNSLQTVRAFDPDFRDSAALYNRAEGEIYRAALSGTVALRTGASPPGLYLRTADSWLWLPGSDAYSTVRADCAFPFYDTPLIAADTPVAAATRTAENSNRPPPSEDARRLVVARLENGRLVAQPLDFNPARFEFFICTHGGVLAGRRGGSPSDQRTNGLFPPEYELLFQALSSPASRRVTLPEGAAVLSLAPELDLLLAGRVGENRLFAYTETEYFLVDLASGANKPLGAERGVPIAARISPDGRQVAYIQALDPADESLPSPSGGSTTRWVTLVTVSEQGSNNVFSWQLTVNPPDFAYFVRQGPHTGKLLIIRQNAMPRAWLVENDFSGKVLWTGAPSAGAWLNNIVTFETGLLLVWGDPGCDGAPGSVTYLDERYQAASPRLHIVPGQFVLQAAQAGDRLVYLLTDRCGSGNRSYNIASLPLADLGSREAEPLLLFHAQMKAVGLVDHRWSIGSGLLAYVEDGALHARSLDGADKVTLEYGVSDLYQLALR